MKYELFIKIDIFDLFCDNIIYKKITENYLNNIMNYSFTKNKKLRKEARA